MKMRAAAAVALTVLVGLGTASYADSAPPPPHSTYTVAYSATGTWQLLALVNAERHASGLQPLAVDPRLAAAARTWAEHMAAGDVLAHNDPLFSRASHTALRMKALGENVGWNYSVRAQHAAFLASAGHRANIRTAGFRSAGFAVVKDSRGRVWSTEDFGTPTARSTR